MDRQTDKTDGGPIRQAQKMLQHLILKTKQNAH